MNSDNMRVIVTKRMLREGLLRCLQKKSIDKISVSELCRESQINRATFYNHYDTPRDLLLELGWEYARMIKMMFEDGARLPMKERISRCIGTLYDNKASIKVLMKSSADNDVQKAISEMFTWVLANIIDIKSAIDLKDDIEYDLVAESYGWAAYHMLRKWILEDIDKTPDEIAEIIIKQHTAKQLFTSR